MADGKIAYDNETKEFVKSCEQKRQTEKVHYQFEWNDLRCLVTVVNIILIMLFGLQISWFGLVIACLGCIKDLTEIKTSKFRWSSLIMHLANMGLNIFFLCQL